MNKMLDISKLEDQLEGLTGRDFSKIEKESRASGNNSVVLTTSSDFQARLAAKALNVNPNDIFDLPLKKYNQTLLIVTNFLFGTLDETANQSVE